MSSAKEIALASFGVLHRVLHKTHVCPSVSVGELFQDPHGFKSSMMLKCLTCNEGVVLPITHVHVPMGHTASPGYFSYAIQCKYGANGNTILLKKQ